MKQYLFLINNRWTPATFLEVLTLAELDSESEPFFLNGRIYITFIRWDHVFKFSKLVWTGKLGGGKDWVPIAPRNLAYFKRFWISEGLEFGSYSANVYYNPIQAV